MSGVQPPRWDAIRSHPLDNVATALRPLNQGETAAMQAGAGSASLQIEATDNIPRCHKLALCAIADGERIIKYGETIGTARGVIAVGAWVHVHNLASTRT